MLGLPEVAGKPGFSRAAADVGRVPALTTALAKATAVDSSSGSTGGSGGGGTPRAAPAPQWGSGHRPQRPRSSALRRRQDEQQRLPPTASNTPRSTTPTTPSTRPSTPQLLVQQLEKRHSELRQEEQEQAKKDSRRQSTGSRRSSGAFAFLRPVSAPAKERTPQRAGHAPAAKQAPSAARVQSGSAARALAHRLVGGGLQGCGARGGEGARFGPQPQKPPTLRGSGPGPKTRALARHGAPSVGSCASDAFGQEASLSHTQPTFEDGDIWFVDQPAASMCSSPGGSGELHERSVDRTGDGERQRDAATPEAGAKLGRFENKGVQEQATFSIEECVQSNGDPPHREVPGSSEEERGGDTLLGSSSGDSNSAGQPPSGAWPSAAAQHFSSSSSSAVVPTFDGSMGGAHFGSIVSTDGGKYFVSVADPHAWQAAAASTGRSLPACSRTTTELTFGALDAARGAQEGRPPRIYFDVEDEEDGSPGRTDRTWSPRSKAPFSGSLDVSQGRKLLQHMGLMEGRAALVASDATPSAVQQFEAAAPMHQSVCSAERGEVGEGAEDPRPPLLRLDKRKADALAAGHWRGVMYPPHPDRFYFAQWSDHAYNLEPLAFSSRPRESATSVGHHVTVSPAGLLIHKNWGCNALGDRIQEFELVDVEEWQEEYQKFTRLRQLPWVRTLWTWKMMNVWKLVLGKFSFERTQQKLQVALMHVRHRDACYSFLMRLQVTLETKLHKLSILGQTMSEQVDLLSFATTASRGRQSAAEALCALEAQVHEELLQQCASIFSATLEQAAADGAESTLTRRSTASERALGLPDALTAVMQRRAQVEADRIWRFVRLCDYRIGWHLRALCHRELLRLLRAFAPRPSQPKESQPVSEARRRQTTGTPLQQEAEKGPAVRRTGADHEFVVVQVRVVRTDPTSLAALKLEPSLEEVCEALEQLAHEGLETLQNVRRPLCNRQLQLYADVADARQQEGNVDDVSAKIMWPCYLCSAGLFNEAECQAAREAALGALRHSFATANSRLGALRLVALRCADGDVEDLNLSESGMFARSCSHKTDGTVSEHLERQFSDISAEGPLAWPRAGSTIHTSVEALLMRLHAFVNSQHDLSDLLPSESMGVLELDISSVLSALQANLSSRASRLEEHCPVVLREAIAVSTAWAAAGIEALTVKLPDSATELVNLLDRIQLLGGEAEDFRGTTAKLSELAEIAAEGSFNVHERLMEGVNRAQKLLSLFDAQLNDATLKAEASMEFVLKNVMADEPRVLGAVEEIQSQVLAESLQTWVSTEWTMLPGAESPTTRMFLAGQLELQFVDATEVQDARSKVDALQSLEEASGLLLYEVEELVYYQERLGMHVHLSKMKFEEMRSQLQVRKMFWQLVSEWHEQMAVWGNTNFREVKLDEVEAQCMQVDKGSGKLGLGNLCAELSARTRGVLLLLDLVRLLQCKHLKEHHLEELCQLCTGDVDFVAGVTLAELIDIGFLSMQGQMNNVFKRAMEEARFAQQLGSLSDTWDALTIFVITSRGRTEIQGTDELREQLHESLATVCKMASSPALGKLGPAVHELQEDFFIMTEAFDGLLFLQHKLLDLMPIFTMPDIMRRLPDESKEFAAVEGWWQQLMERLSKKESARRFLMDAALREAIVDSRRRLDRLQINLDDFIEAKRSGFPRLYFLSGSDILELMHIAHVLSSKGIENVPTYPVRKCFRGVDRLMYDQEHEDGKRHVTASGFYSREGEPVMLANTVRSCSTVDEWLNSLEETITRSVRRQVWRASHGPPDLCPPTIDAPEQVVEDKEFFRQVVGSVFCAQALGVATLTKWCRLVEASFRVRRDRQPGNEMETAEARVSAWSSRLCEMAKLRMTRVQRGAAVMQLMIAMQCREVVRRLVGISCSSAFEWQCQPRFYWVSGASGESESMVLQVRLLVSSLPYGFEYYGLAVPVVPTPLTDRCYLAVAQAAVNSMGLHFVGPGGAGKTELARETATRNGLHYVTFTCCEDVSIGFFSTLLRGLAQQGCWACLEEIGRSSFPALAVLAEQFRELRRAGKTGLKAYVFEGAKIRMRPFFGLIVTTELDAGTVLPVPESLSVQLRPVAVMSQSQRSIAHVTLLAHGFLEAEPLSVKLATLFQLASQGLYQHWHCDFGLRTLKRVLTTMIGLRMRSATCTGVVNDSANGGLPGNGRSTVRHTTFQPITTSHEKQSLRKTLKVTASALSRASTFADAATAQGDSKTIKDEEQGIAVYVVKQVVSSKLAAADKKVFETLLGEVFRGVSIEDVGEEENNPALAIFKDGFRQEMIDRGYHADASECFCGKAVMLQETMQVRVGTIITGPPGSGKSTMLRLSVDAATQLSKDTAEFASRDLHFVNPSSLAPEELFGAWGLDRLEDRAPLVLQLLRGSTQNLRKCILCLDGPFEEGCRMPAMESMLDEATTLCLVGSEHLFLSERARFVFELDHLANASLAMISRCGIVSIAADDVGWCSAVRSWLDHDLPETAPWMKEFGAATFPKSQALILELLGRLHAHPALAGSAVPGIQMRLTTMFMRLLGVLMGPEPQKDLILTPASIFFRQPDGDSPMPNDLPAEAGLSPNAPLNLETYFTACVAFSLEWAVQIVAHSQTQSELRSWCSSNISGLSLPEGTTSLREVFVDWRFPPGYLRHWQEQVPAQLEPFDSSAFLGADVIVHTKDTVTFGFLGLLLARKSHHVVLAGPVSSGKTLTAQRIARQLERVRQPPMQVRISMLLGHAPLQEIRGVCANAHAQTSLLGRSGQRLLIFVDDLGMPRHADKAVRGALEVLRQYVERRGCHLFEAGWRWKGVQEAVLVGTLASSELSFLLDPKKLAETGRLLRHLATFVMPKPDVSAQELFLSVVVRSIFAGVAEEAGAALVDEIRFLEDATLKGTLDHYTSVVQTHRATSACPHYQYDFRDLAKMARGWMTLRFRMNMGKDAFIKVWAHEAMRVLHDRLSSEDDQLAYVDLLKFQLGQYFDTDCIANFQDLCFGPDVLFHGDGSQYREVDLTSDRLFLIMGEWSQKLNESRPEPLQMVLLQSTVTHVCRLLRILVQPKSHALCIGQVAGGLRSLCLLAAHAMGIEPTIPDGAQLASVTVGPAAKAAAAGGGPGPAPSPAAQAVAAGAAGFGSMMQRLLEACAFRSKPMMLLMLSWTLERETLQNLVRIAKTEDLSSWLSHDAADVLLARARELGHAAAQEPNTLFACLRDGVRQFLHLVVCMTPADPCFGIWCRTAPGLMSSFTLDYHLPWGQATLGATASLLLGSLSEAEASMAAVTCVAVHTMTMSAATRLGLQQESHDSSETFISFLRVFDKFYQSRREALLRKHDLLLKARQKHLEIQRLIEPLGDRLVELEAKCEYQARHAHVVSEKMAFLQTILDEQQLQLATQIQDCKERIEELTAQVQEQAPTKAEDPEPFLIFAQEALECLDRRDIDELKALRRPPELVERVLECVCVLLGIKPERSVTRQMLAEPAVFLRGLRNLDTDQITSAVAARLKEYVDEDDFEPSEVAHQSKPAAHLCRWCVSLHHFAEARFAQSQKLDIQRGTQVKLEMAISCLESRERDRERLIAQSAGYTKETTDAEADLASPRTERDWVRDRLRLVKKLSSSLDTGECKWEPRIEEMEQRSSTLLADMILCGAFVTHLAARTKESRDAIQRKWTEWFEDNSMARPRRSHDWTVRKHLAGLDALSEWRLQDLVGDDNCVDSAAVVVHAPGWPWCVDPVHMAKRWLQKMKSKAGMKTARSLDPRAAERVAECIRSGFPVLLHDCCEMLPTDLDEVLVETLSVSGVTIRASQASPSSSPTHRAARRQLQPQARGNIVLTQSVPAPCVHPAWQLFVVSTCEKPQVSRKLADNFTVVCFTPNIESMAAYFLDCVLRIEDPKTVDGYMDTLAVVSMETAKLRDFEDQMLERLSAPCMDEILSYDEEIIGLVHSAAASSQRLREVLLRRRRFEHDLADVKARLLCVAENAAEMCMASWAMAAVNPFYAFPFSQAVDCVKSTALAYQQTANPLSQRVDGEKLTEWYLESLRSRVLYALFTLVSRCVLARHRMFFAVLVCVQSAKRTGALDKLRHAFLVKGLDALAEVDEERRDQGDKHLSRLPRSTPNDLCISQECWANARTLAIMFPAVFGGLPSHIRSHLTEWKAALAKSPPSILPAAAAPRVFSAVSILEEEAEDDLSEAESSAHEGPSSRPAASMSSPNQSSDPDSFHVSSRTSSVLRTEPESTHFSLCCHYPSPWGTAESLQPMDQFLLIRALQPTKLGKSALGLARSHLGAQFIAMPSPSLRDVYEQSTCLVPTVLLVSPGMDSVSIITGLFADVRNGRRDLQVFSFGEAQDAKLAATVGDAMLRDCWVLIQNCHLAKRALFCMEDIFDEYKGGLTCNDNFRLFLSSSSAAAVSPAFLGRAMRAVLELPSGVRSKLVQRIERSANEDWEFSGESRSLRFFQVDDAGSQKPHFLSRVWQNLFFSLSLFHGIVLERGMFGVSGFSVPYDFEEIDFSTARDALKSALQGLLSQVTQIDDVNSRDAIVEIGALAPWEVLEGVVVSVCYGGRVADEWDRQRLAATFRRFVGVDCLQRMADEGRSGAIPHFPSAFRGSPKEAALQAAGGGAAVGMAKRSSRIGSDVAGEGSDRLELFGLHPQALISLDQRRADELLSLLRDAAPWEDDFGVLLAEAGAEDSVPSPVGAIGRRRRSSGVRGASLRPSSTSEGLDSGGGSSRFADSGLGGLAALRQNAAALAAASSNLSRRARAAMDPTARAALRIVGAVRDKVPTVKWFNSAFEGDDAKIRWSDFIDDPMWLFAKHEADLFSGLLKQVNDLLSRLEDAIHGRIPFSAKLEEVRDTVVANELPHQWREVGFPSSASLTSWASDLRCRIAWLRQWVLQKSHPKCFVISHFWRPRAFLVAARRVAAVCLDEALEDLQLQANPTKHEAEGDIQSAADLGVYVTGMWLHGASWSIKEGAMVEPKEAQHFVHMPVMHLFPELESRVEMKRFFRLPLRQTLPPHGESIYAEASSAAVHTGFPGGCSESGDSSAVAVVTAIRRWQLTSFVMAVDLPCQGDAATWTLRGVALFCSIEGA